MSTTSPKPCSRRATWAGCPERPSAGTASSSDLRFLFALVAALLLIAGPAAASGTASPYTVTSAEARLEPDGLPAEERRVELPFRWDHAFPGRGGKATYRIALPAATAPASEPAALLFAGVGNQVAIEFNGTPLAGFGTLGDPSYDTKGTPFVPVAVSLQRTGAAQELLIRTTMQRQRGAALAVPLRDMQGHTVAALNVVLSGARYQEEAVRRDMLPLLFEAAREVRALL